MMLIRVSVIAVLYIMLLSTCLATVSAALLPIHSSRVESIQAKTNCNCSLYVKKPRADAFETNAIAVSFVVSVSDNTTLDEKYSFIWVQDVRSKFLLSLPDDSEILSLTTLQHSVNTGKIEMQLEKNEDCFSGNKLSSECKAEVIVAAFYNGDFPIAPGQPFCFPPFESSNNSENTDIVHRCCSLNSNGYINCTEVIRRNNWVAYAIVAAQFASAIIFIFTPLLFKYLPTRDTQVVKKSKRSNTKQSGTSIATMNVDSMEMTQRKLLTLLEPLSFVTCGGNEAQPCYSRFCRTLALLIFPIIFCVYVMLFFLNNHETKIRTNISYYSGLVTFLKPPVEYYLFSIVIFCIILLCVLVLIPGRLSGIGKALSGRKDEKMFLNFEKPEHLVNPRSGRIGFQFLHSNMAFHLKCLCDVHFWLFILKVILSPCNCLLRMCYCRNIQQSELLPVEEQEQTSIFCVLLGVVFIPILMPVWLVIVLAAVLIYVTPVGYVAFRIGTLLFKTDMPCKCECCERLHVCIRLFLVPLLYGLFILFFLLVLASYIFVTLMFGVFGYILCKVFLYTLIGLGFNVDFYLPYTVAAFFVVLYVAKAFTHYISVYENLRIVLFEECEKYEQQMMQRGNTNDASSLDASTGVLLFFDKNNNPSIPVNLFVVTYRRLRPRGKTFFTILTKLILTLLYMSVSFASIMSLDQAEDTSVYVQSVFLFVTFLLPILLQHAGNSYNRQRKKELEYQVRFIIHRYVSKVSSTNIGSSSPPDSSNLDVNNEFFEV